MICLCRLERQAVETGERKWNGVALAMQRHRLTAILVEFSGGLMSNSTQEKANRDLSKLLPSMKAINNSREKLPGKAFCVRFSGKPDAPYMVGSY